MSDIFKNFGLKQADNDSDYSMLHHHDYACACVLFELAEFMSSRHCLGDFT